NFGKTWPKTATERTESSDSASRRLRAGERRRAHHNSPYGQAQVHHEAAASPSVAVGGSWERVIAAVAQRDCRLRPDVFARKPARCCCTPGDPYPRARRLWRCRVPAAGRSSTWSWGGPLQKRGSG